MERSSPGCQCGVAPDVTSGRVPSQDLDASTELPEECSRAASAFHVSTSARPAGANCGRCPRALRCPVVSAGSPSVGARVDRPRSEEMSRYFDVAPPPLPSLAAVASTVPLSGLAPGERRLRVTFNATRQAGGDEMLHASRDVSWTRTAAHPRSGRRRCWCGQRPAALSGVANNGIRRQPRRVKRARGYGGALATNRRLYGHWQAPGTGTSIPSVYGVINYIRTDTYVHFAHSVPRRARLIT